MSEKLNISFRIKAIDDFTLVMQKAQKQLESLKRQANEHMSAYINVTVLDGGVKEQLDDMQDHVDRLIRRSDIDIKTRFENKGLWDAIEEFEFFKSERPKNATVVTKFTSRKKDLKDLEKLQSAMQALRDEADEVGKLNVSVGGLDELRDINNEMKGFNKNVKGVRGNLKKPLVAKVATEGVPKVNKFFELWKDSMNEVRNRIARLANTFRNFGELFQHTFISGFLMLAPIAVPAIASVGGALGALLPILGTVGGGIMAMATSFGLAGAGAVAFGMLAKSALGDIFGVSEDLAKLNEKLAKETDSKKRAKIMEQIANATAGLTEEQKRGLIALQALKKDWGKIAKALEPQVVDTFTIAMSSLRNILQDIEPMFSSVATHAQNLMKWLSVQIDTSDVQAFYDMLNTSAGPSLERIGKAMTNFGIGLGNLMVAFNPLATDFEKGFLKMSESFREWTANLSGSEKFQSFIKYVKENGPKLLEIIGNIVGGLVGMGTAFAPFAEDMLDGLVDMTQRFQEWGDELKNNKGFQDFIKYVQENGPKFLSFLGEFISMLINIGIAFAPLGEKIMSVVTSLMSLGNEFFENNRWAGELIAGIGWLASTFAFFYPIVRIAGGVLRGLWGTLKIVWGWVVKLKPVWDKLIGVFRAVIPWISRVGVFLARFVNPITAIILAVITVAYVIYKNWGDIKKWSEDMVFKVTVLFFRMKRKFEETMEGIKSAFNIIKNINLYESGRKIIGSLIDGVLSKVDAVGKAIKKVVGPNLRDYLPFSPAKKGPLKDLNKLNFGGPIIDSIKGDGPRIASAMNRMLQAPTMSSAGYSFGVAGNTSSANAVGTQGVVQSDVAPVEYYFELPVVIDGREVARATARFTQEELDRMKRDKNRASGRVGTV